MTAKKSIVYISKLLRKLNKSTLTPWIFGIIVSILFFILFETLIYFKQQEIYSKTERDAISYGSKLISSMNRELNAIIYLTHGIDAYIKVRNKNLNPDEFEAILKEISQNSKLIRNLAVAKGTVVIFVEPLEGNEKIMGVDYKKLLAQWHLVQKAINTKKGTLAGPVNLVQGGVALIYRKPIYINDNYWGIISTVIDINKLFTASFNELNDKGYKFSIRENSGLKEKKIIYGNKDLFENSKAVFMSASIPNGTWEYSIISEQYNSIVKTLNIYHWSARLISIIILIIAALLIRLRRKNIERKIKYHLLSENLSNIIWVKSLDTNKFTFISPSIKEFLGFTVNEVIANKCDNPYDNTKIQFSITDEIKKEVEDLIATHSFSKSKRFEYIQQHKNGKNLWVETEVKILPDSNKIPTELLGITRIIEDRKQIENKLRESEARLRTIINTTSAGISIIDVDGLLQYTNPNSINIHAYSQEDIIGTHFKNIVHPDDIELVKQMILDITNNNKNFINSELRLIHKTTKQNIWININATRYPKNDSQDKVSILIVFQDVSKQKENEQKLKEVIVTKDKFISVLAHDLKSPFNSILGLLMLLKKNIDKYNAAKVKKLIDNVYNASENTYFLLENLLEWARTQENRIPFKIEKIELNSIAKDCIRLMSNQLETKKINIIQQIPEELIATADGEMVKTILRNLISNAIKFTPAEGEIILTAISNDKEVEITVSDNGIGMDERTVTSLFKVGKTKSNIGTGGEIGTGFGLIICKEFVEKQSGKILVKSKLGQGSSFIFTLPSSENSNKNLIKP
ncbi:MAG: PAS domain S-box protein [Bacteroidales bacterium]|nr:PAS domain S-box protein [Bacteroidales bacterium]MBN2758569.1 PAS domain S-box protein [Bacteroidales bacterium]